MRPPSGHLTRTDGDRLGPGDCRRACRPASGTAVRGGSERRGQWPPDSRTSAPPGRRQPRPASGAQSSGRCRPSSRHRTGPACGRSPTPVIPLGRVQLGTDAVGAPLPRQPSTRGTRRVQAVPAVRRPTTSAASPGDRRHDRPPLPRNQRARAPSEKRAHHAGNTTAAQAFQCASRAAATSADFWINVQWLQSSLTTRDARTAWPS